jgi:hypothetical protein
MVGRVVIAMVNFYSEFSPGQDVFEKLWSLTKIVLSKAKLVLKIANRNRVCE